ncbi:hypothetical protein [Arthrobacter crystallopoietes]|uniref:hypothetical protein n=1 Tax=Crystallibacter crystallopoietes TaxID=37928 RepID=UPI001ABDBA72|nr:hypothetical protein [Arthrobacter crystallopoietes]QTG82081.1 hypothetical protein J5251_05750 [Arthrobacter crystallopoietes]
MNSTFALSRARQSLYAMLVAAVLAVGSLAGAIPAHAADAFLQGRVVDAEGKPLYGIQVSAFSGPDAGVSGVPADTTGTTNTLGQYSLALSSDRSYRLRYADTQTRLDGPYITEWHQDAAGPETAVPVAVTSPGITLPDTSLAAPVLEQFTDAPVPVLSGTGAPGTVLTVDPGTWSPEPVLTYAWHRNGAFVGSGTSLTVSPFYGGGNITVKVTAKKSGYATTTRESAPVSVPLSEWDPPAPAITGAPQGGTVLNADIGLVAYPATYEFQWFADGAPVTPKGSYYRSYSPETADAGKRLTVQVTWSRPGFHTVTRTSAPTHPVVLAVFEPGIPTISGTTKVGHTLTMDPGIWKPALVQNNYKVEWLRDGDVVDMQWMDPWYFHTAAGKYTLTAADLGKTISVKVTSRRIGYETTSKTSTPTEPVAIGTFNPASPTISGVPTVGHRWAVNSKGWASGTTFKHQWYRDGLAVKGATRPEFYPTVYDLGRHTYSVKVTGSKAGYTTLTKTSDPFTVTVAKGTFGNAEPVVVAPTGTKKVGYTLTAPESAVYWSGPSVPSDETHTMRYQWYRGSTAIKSATGKTYKLTGSDAGKTIKVRLATSLPGYNTSYRYSKATTAVAKGTLKVSSPTVSGTKKVGYRLTANPRTWTAGTKFTYQWYRSGRAIKGATGRTYKLVTADRYDTIKVKVTGYQTGYTTVAKTSAATSKVR